MRTTARLAAGSLIAGTVLMGGTAALAAGPSSDEAAAAKAAASPAARQRLGAFFVHLDQHQRGQLVTRAVPKAAAQAKAPRLEGSVQRVYSLNPAFVKGDGGAPVATFAYMAVGAASASGQHATVWLTRSGAGWQVMNVISGTEEAVYPARAQGGTVFTEPQIHAWYRLKDGRVTALNDTAASSVGRTGVTVAAYRRLVRSRYADKLPGTAYQRSGKLGGFSPATGVSDPAPDRGPAPALLALGAGGAVTAAGVALVRRRRQGSY
ncbi:hypothetical protein BJY14_002323 [Actinomadura luteofluorescens]|uniref:Gram-positive cocci surface proteins LPxTG domain-containing protein n=2 Tax=Actinomadura luteofluorescens TaxID=46163 RepID=A0A7Y9EFB7_9ACTN|nr:hypothetical protein [Actinomadura luteofluorescens]NYD46340.1 hypothetical protein [Actinomadura luteofluorescens]